MSVEITAVIEMHQACFVLIWFCHSVFLGISSPGLIYACCVVHREVELLLFTNAMVIPKAHLLPVSGHACLPKTSLKYTVPFVTLMTCLSTTNVTWVYSTFCDKYDMLVYQRGHMGILYLL